MTRVCLIGYKMRYDNYPFANYDILKRAFERKNCVVSFLDVDTARANVNNEIVINGEVLPKFDLGVFVTPIFTIPKVAYYGRKNGIVTALKTYYNNAIFVNEIEPHVNASCKNVMYEYLRKDGIPYPNTSSLYYDTTDEDLEQLVQENLGGYPVVLKHPLSSQGRGVFLCNNLQDIRQTEQDLRANKIGNIPIVLQQYFTYSDGISMNVRVIGDKVYSRITLGNPYNDAFKSNFAKGRGYVACKPIPELEDLSIKATRALGLDTARLDVFVGEEGFVICEVNSIGSIVDSEMTWLTEVGEELADYCLQKLNGVS